MPEKIENEKDYKKAMTIVNGDNDKLIECLFLKPEYILFKKKNLIDQRGGRKPYELEELKKIALFHITLNSDYFKNLIHKTQEARDKAEIEQYFHFEAKSNFSLHLKDQTIRPTVYHFDNLYGLGEDKIIIGFPVSNSLNHFTLTYRHKLKDTIKYTFQFDDINKYKIQL